MRCESHGYFRGFVCKKAKTVLPGEATPNPGNCPAVSIKMLTLQSY